MIEPLRDDENAALLGLTTASKALISARGLQKRVDRKFVIPRRLIPDLIASLGDDFHVVLSNEQRYATYDTLYFDTPDFAFFHQHRQGRRPRHKVRIRHYVERNLCFLETKTKDRYSITTKHRFPRPPADFELREGDFADLRSAIGAVETLEAAVWGRFPRITLVGVDHRERLTIDAGLSVRRDESEARFDDIGIVEIKQPKFSARTPGAMALRALRLQSSGLSKYCVALSVLGAVDRVAVFRPAIRTLEANAIA